MAKDISITTKNDGIPRNKPRGKALSIVELAELLDVSNQRIHQLLREGLPVFEKGGKGIPHVFSSYDAIWWYIEYEQKKKRGLVKENPDAPDSKARIAETRVAMAELQLAKQRGSLFDFNDYLPYIKDKMVVFRQAMATVAMNVREKYGNEVAKFVDRQITTAINSYQRGLENIPNEAKE